MTDTTQRARELLAAELCGDQHYLNAVRRVPKDAALRAISAALSNKAEGEVDPNAPVFKYLLGEGPLDGYHFGEPHETERGYLWWRKHLRAALTTDGIARREERPKLYVQFSDDGKHLRKWSRTPFAQGIEFDAERAIRNLAKPEGGA